MNLKLTSSYIYFIFPQALKQTNFTVLWKMVRFWKNKRIWNYLRGQEGFSSNNNTLNLNAIPLQISKKSSLGQGKVIVLKMTKMSQHKNTEPCENMPLILTSLKKEQFCQDQYLFNPFIRKTRCPTYICMPLYPTPQYDNNKAHFFFLGTTFDFPFLSSFGFWRCNNKKQSNKYTITVLLIILTLPYLYYFISY